MKLKFLLPNVYFLRKNFKEHKSFSKIKNPKEYSIKKYKDKFGVDINLDKPETFYEKLLYLKLNHLENNPELLVDKVIVKDYLTGKGYSHIIPKKIDSFRTFKEFKKNYKNIVNKNSRFVIKLNHTSGDVFIFNNGILLSKIGEKVPRRYVFACLKHRLKFSYYFVGLEKVYKNIVPQILIEEYMASLDTKGLDEYKFFVNKGQIKMINVVYGRQNGSLLKEAFTDEKLRKLNARQDQNMLEQNEIKKPKCFDNMVKFCKDTVKDRLLIRVDLMTDGDNYYFCEFTFFDCGGFNHFLPEETNYEIGSKFDISL